MKRTRRRTNADVAELADALDLGSSGAIRGGSTPSIRTKVCKAHFVPMNITKYDEQEYFVSEEGQ